MSELNMANRMCANLVILNYKDRSPFLDARFCNTTTYGFSSDNTYATIKGVKAIAYSNPLEGTMKLEFQVAPFKVYSMLSDGTISNTALRTFSETVEATETSNISFKEEAVVSGTVYVYAENDDMGSPLEVTVDVSAKTITGAFVSGSNYVVRGIKTLSSGVQRIEFNDNKTPKDYFIQMETVDKAENGGLIPKVITGYKCVPKRNLDCTMSSTGDPVSMTIEFDCLRDIDGNVMDIAIYQE